jgi:hypothetical protein
MLSTVGGARRGGGGGAVPHCVAGEGCRRAEGAIRSVVRQGMQADRGRNQVGGPMRWCSATPHGLGGRRRLRARGGSRGGGVAAVPHRTNDGGAR